MASTDGRITGIFRSENTLGISLSIAAIYVIYLLGSSVYNALLGPLSKFPGPKSRAFSSLPNLLATFMGRDNKEIPALHAKYGPVVRIAPDSLSYVGNAQVWKDVYGFKKPGQLGVYKDFTFYTHPLNEVPGLITADDPTHSRQRKIVSHAFSDKALKEQEPLLKSWTELLKQKLMEGIEKGVTFDMVKMYNCTTFDIMVYPILPRPTVFTNCKSTANPPLQGDLTFAEGLNMLEDGEYSPWVKMIYGGIKRATCIRAFKAWNPTAKWLVEKTVSKIPKVRGMQVGHFRYTSDRVDRRLAATPERPDLWSRILEKSKGPEGLSLQEHYSIASLFMIAGTETTATALSGTTYHVLKNPQYLAKLTSELRGEFSSLDDLHLESLARLPYLSAVLREGLRMYPPVPVALPRRTHKGGHIVNGEFIPEGTQISVHHLSTYRSEDNFKNPNEFRPERWLGDPEYKDDNLDSLEPFSVGPRNCLGKV